MSTRYELSKHDRHVALKIVAMYVVVAGLWIYVSDTLFGFFMHVSTGLVAYSTLKGFAFIVVTACFFYFFVARYLRQRQVDAILEKVNRDLEDQVRERTWAVEESEARYRALVLASSDVVYRMSPDWKEMRELSGRNFLSDTAAPITDWLQKYIHPEDQPQVMQMIEEVIRTRDTFQLEHRVLRGDGTIGWTFSRAVPLYDHTGKLVEWVGHANDVTRRKVAEEAVKKSERKFSTFFHAASVLMSITTLEEGTVLDINDVALQALGYEREEVIGQTVHLAHVWDVPADRERAVRMLEEQGTLRDQEMTIRGKGGLVKVCLVSAELIVLDGQKWILAVIRDITQRKRAEEALQRSEKKFAAVFQEAPALLAISTLQEGRYVEVNETTLRTLGYRREEMIGHTAAELNLWEDLSFRGRILQALETQGSARDLEIRLRGRQGQVIFGLLSAEYIDIDGERYMLSLVKDVTLKRLAEEQVELLNTQLSARADELEEANRELEAFNYSVAHDLRSPLNLISGYAQIIMMSCGELMGEECAGYLQQTIDGVDRMSRMISALLDFSGMARSELHRRSIDLSAVAAEVAAELKLSEPKRRAEFRIGEGVVVDGDPDLLRVVVDNLLGNAWKYSSMREEAIIEFGATVIDGESTCFVRDNGPGFDMADAGKLFTPFHRLADTAALKGFGIGLATVERIIRRHGGRIWAEGEKDRGATFYFTLPQKGADCR
jgi:PAS domain S-box-containing protein